MSRHTVRDYGNRVGAFRVVDALSGRGVPGTVALNADVCDHAPAVVDAMADLDWEFMGHGETNSRLLSGLEPAEERRVIEATHDRIAEHTGVAPRGWLGPSRAETYRTPSLLAAAGFDYVADYVNDDQPYPVATEAGELVSIPYSTVVSDKVFERGPVPGAVFEGLVRDQFDVLYAEGAAPGDAKVMCISLHPYLIGVPARIRALERALDYVVGHDDVWLATGGEIVDHYTAAYR